MQSLGTRGTAVHCFGQVMGACKLSARPYSTEPERPLGSVGGTGAEGCLARMIHNKVGVGGHQFSQVISK